MLRWQNPPRLRRHHQHMEFLLRHSFLLGVTDFLEEQNHLIRIAVELAASCRALDGFHNVEAVHIIDDAERVKMVFVRHAMRAAPGTRWERGRNCLFRFIPGGI